jgi:cyclopropane-fatty-acyl-phospholipid synthase
VLRLAISRLGSLVRGGLLELALPDGTRLRAGEPASGLRGELIVRRDDFWHRVAARGEVGLGEAFVAGDWTSPDPALPLEVLAHTLNHHAWRPPLRTLNAARTWLPVLPRPSDIASSKQNVSYHYDLGNDFFEAFLDPSMTYSCAEFTGPGMSLEEAQAAKYRSICDQLQLGPCDHLLEVGCGWGGFAELAAREYGARVTAVTISERQWEYARRRIARAGLDRLVDVRLQDYRLVEGSYSKIASIEMLEAVGPSEYETYFRTLQRRLAPGGRACIQVIGVQDREYPQTLRSKGWVREYIFPGGLCPAIGVLTAAMTRSSDLQLYSLREIGHHYAATLRAWRERLYASADQLRERGYSEQFQRAWEYYLAVCEAGFRAGNIRTTQLVLAHAGYAEAHAGYAEVRTEG